MPELPEVETVVRELRTLIPEKEIKDIQAVWDKSLVNKSSIPIAGQKIIEIGRKGKYLLVRLNVTALIIHLRMTGQLLFISNKNTLVDPHVRVKILFTDSTAIYFKDTRKFGRIYHVDKEDEILNKIGIDTLDPELDADLFKSMLSQSKLSIKAFLLSQDKISGVGNIYADESLFRAGLHPASIACKIPGKKTDLLYQSILNIMHEAIGNMGSTISDYRDTYGNSGNNQKFFKVYQRTNESCVICRSPIIKLKIAGRGTHFCSNCQKLYK